MTWIQSMLTNEPRGYWHFHDLKIVYNRGVLAERCAWWFLGNEEQHQTSVPFSRCLSCIYVKQGLMNEFAKKANIYLLANSFLFSMLSCVFLSLFYSCKLWGVFYLTVPSEVPRSDISICSLWGSDFYFYSLENAFSSVSLYECCQALGHCLSFASPLVLSVLWMFDSPLIFISHKLMCGLRCSTWQWATHIAVDIMYWILALPPEMENRNRNKWICFLQHNPYNTEILFNDLVLFKVTTHQKHLRHKNTLNYRLEIRDNILQTINRQIRPPLSRDSVIPQKTMIGFKYVM